MLFGFSLIIIIWKVQRNREFFVTMFCLLFFMSALSVYYLSDSGYFQNPLDSFFLAYAFANCERLYTPQIPTLNLRIFFNIAATVFRLLLIPANDKSIFLLQILYLGLTIYLEVDKERHDKDFFTSYYRNKEQLTKFKDLVVQNIPESIVIITQDLMKPLFVNNSFISLFKSSSTCSLDIRAQLSQFLIQENSKNSSQEDFIPGEEEPLKSPSKIQHLLNFIEGTIHQADRFIPENKFSCNIIYKKPHSLGIQREYFSQEDQQPEERTFEAQILHVTWDLEPAVAVILHDITQQHTILALKIADENKNNVLSTVSHELRTPLNGMLGMIQLVEKRLQDNELVQYLNICKNSGKLLIALVNSILDLDQIRAKKFKLAFENVSVHEILDDIHRLFEFQCKEKGLYLRLQISPTITKKFVTDRNRLSQIFINLVGNALKFTKKGGITIVAGDSLTQKGYLEFKVKDTGIGIKDEDRPKLFKMFGKLDQANARDNHQGIGLGLLISNKLARMLSGDAKSEGIILESDERGSTFSFLIKKDLGNMMNFVRLASLESISNIPLGLIDEESNVAVKLRKYTVPTSEGSQIFGLFSNNSKNLSQRTVQDSCIQVVEVEEKYSPRFRTYSHHGKIEGLGTGGKLSTVVVIDDNPLNLVIAKHLISAYKRFKVKTELYAKEAIDYLENNDYEGNPIGVILIDCQMPEMDGYEATRILKGLMKKGKIPEIPIVALTANNNESDKKACLKAGMCEYLTKPLTDNDLVGLFKKYIPTHSFGPGPGN